MMKKTATIFIAISMMASQAGFAGDGAGKAAREARREKRQEHMQQQHQENQALKESLKGMTDEQRKAAATRLDREKSHEAGRFREAKPIRTSELRDLSPRARTENRESAANDTA